MMYLWCQGGAYLNPDFLRIVITQENLFFLKLGIAQIGGEDWLNYFDTFLQIIFFKNDNNDFCTWERPTDSRLQPVVWEHFTLLHNKNLKK